MKQLVINGKKSYDDFGVCIATRKISQPKKKSIKGSVPFSNITYDFSKIDGEIYWEERTLEYAFDIAEFTTEEMEELKEKLLDWLLNVHDTDIYDPYIDGYHFHGSFDSDSWDEDFGAGTLGISFTVYPYKISNKDENVVEKIGVSEDGNVKGNFVGLKIDGKSVQNGTPTPDAPVEIQSFDCSNIIANETNIPFELTLRSLPNGVCDTYENGVITRRIGFIVLDGTEGGWVDGGLVINNIYRFANNLFTDTTKYKARSTYLSNKFSYCGETPSISVEGISNTPNMDLNRFWLFVDITRLNGSSANDLKEWLFENPVTVLYELATPTIENLELPTISSNVVISFDSELQTTFEVYYNETKTLSIRNDSSHRISPTIVADGSFVVTMNNTSYAINSGTYEAVEFYLESGLNEVSISGYGSIAFSYKGEKF